MLTNLEIWQKVSRSNNLIKYFIVSLCIVSLYGQYSDNERNSDYTFKSALKEYNNGNYSVADKIINNLPNTESNRYDEQIALLSMRIKLRLKNYQESKAIGNSIFIKYPDSDYKSDVLITFGDIFIAEGMYDASFRAYFKSLKNYRDKHYIKNILKRLFLSLQFGVSEYLIEELLSFETDQTLRQVLLLAKAQIDLQNGYPQKAANTLSEIDSHELLKVNKTYYNKLKDKIKTKSKGRAIIGVVLPLSGKEAKVGKEFLDGLNYAVENDYSDDFDLSFIVYDNMGDELKTLEIFQTLSKNPNVAAILGPISAENSVIAGSVADKSGIPILLPSTTINGLSEISNNIFMMNSDLQMRGEVAAQLVAETLEAQSVAILAPADKFGKGMVDGFTKKLDEYNITPDIVEWYSGIPINLDRQFRSIRGKAWDLTDSTFVGDSIGFMIDSASVNSVYIFEELTAKDSSEILLNSIDVIYMPIHDGQLEYVGAQFPAYNLETIVVGNDYWGDLGILRRESIGPHLSGMYIVSNYLNYQIDLLNNNFDMKYSSYFYQAIDCYNLLANSITIARRKNEPVKKILSKIDDYDGIFGSYNFTENDDRNINSMLKIAQFNGYNFREFVIPEYSY